MTLPSDHRTYGITGRPGQTRHIWRDGTGKALCGAKLRHFAEQRFLYTCERCSTVERREEREANR